MSKEEMGLDATLWESDNRQTATWGISEVWLPNAMWLEAVPQTLLPPWLLGVREALDHSDLGS